MLVSWTTATSSACARPPRAVRSTRSACIPEALQLREAIYRLFSAFAAGMQPAPTDLGALKTAYVALLAHAQLVAGDDGARWVWPAEDGALERVLWRAVESAVALIASKELGRVRECPGEQVHAPGCLWT